MENEKELKTVHFPAMGEQYKELHQIVLEITAVFDKHNADASTVCSVLSVLIDVIQKDFLNEEITLKDFLQSMNDNIMMSRRVNKHKY